MMETDGQGAAMQQREQKQREQKYEAKQENNLNSEITQEFEVDAADGEERLDKYLARLLPGRSRTFLQGLIKEGNVFVDDLVRKVSYRVAPGDLIAVTLPKVQEVTILPEDIPLDILYEDADVLVVNKPKGMVVHPSAGHVSGTLVNAVLYHCRDSLSGINGELRPGIVHRIDKDTTGALIVCKNDRAHVAIAEQIKAHSVTRRYRGIACGIVEENQGRIEGTIGRDPHNRLRMAVNVKGGKPAVTHYRVLERFQKYTYLEFELETGRTHQIRAHFASIGHPLLGDALYGHPTEFKHLQGQTLHAMVIGFVHPSTGEYLEFEAALPAYFQDLLEKLQPTRIAMT